MLGHIKRVTCSEVKPGKFLAPKLYERLGFLHFMVGKLVQRMEEVLKYDPKKEKMVLGQIIALRTILKQHMDDEDEKGKGKE